MLLEAIVRRFPALRSLSEATTGGRMTGALSLAVAQVESEHTEMTRAGRRFTGLFSSTTGIGTVTTVPTTTANWTMYNADLNRAYVIDSVTAAFLSGTSGIGGTLLGIVTPITATIPTISASIAVANASGGGLTSKVNLSIAAYTIPTPTGMTQWAVLPGQQGQSSGVAPGLGGSFTADVRGRVIVPPGRALGLALLTAAGTSPLFLMGVTWHEIEADLE